MKLFNRHRTPTTIGLALIGLLVLVWTVLPLYHMVLMSVTPTALLFGGPYTPTQPTLENFRIVFAQDHHFLGLFWRQLFNSFFVALMAVLIVLTVASSASYVIGRLRPRWGNWLSNTALLTYVIPASFLAIPFYQIMSTYGLLNNPLSLILAMATFATPYAIWVFRQYADRSISRELDDAAEVDGATAFQIFYMVYLPLMAPVLVAIGTYTLLMAWNEYLYAFLLLSSETRLTLPLAMGHFLVSDDAPWNLLMATALIYAIPPAILYYLVRRHMTTGLTGGSVKG